MDLFGAGLDLEIIKKIFGDAAAGDFSRTLAIFVAAAYVHGRKVSKTISEECGKLVTVLKADLDMQRKMLEALTHRFDGLNNRVSTLEKLNKGE